MNTPPYDSTQDTLDHIALVAKNLELVMADLRARRIAHDASKLTGIEKECFDVVTPKLKGLTYGSDEYRATLREMKPALDHHYAHNDHHPEWDRANGINGMNLISLIEMLCDWKAATQRHADGDMTRSMEINKDRFKIDDQLMQILWNTVRYLGFDTPK